MHRANYIGLTVVGLALSLGTGAVEGEMVARGRRERDGVAGHALLRFEEELPDRRRR